MGRNKMLAVALGKSPSDELRTNLSALSARMKGPVGLFFTKLPREEVGLCVVKVGEAPPHGLLLQLSPFIAAAAGTHGMEGVLSMPVASLHPLSGCVSECAQAPAFLSARASCISMSAHNTQTLSVW
jgi:hypothetical protein